VIEMTDYGRNHATSWVFSLLLAAAAFFITPFVVYLIGVVLFAGRPGYGEQVLGFGLFIYGSFAAFPGALYWVMFPFLKDRAGRPVRSIWSAWAIAVVGYGVFILAVILAAWLSFPGRPLPWGPRR
jgi:hypothetical protein